jgi:hypothetical protein
MWGQDLPTATLTSLGVAAGTALLSVMTYLVARQSRPDNLILQVHSVATAVLVGMSLLVTQIFGWHRPWADTYILFGAVLVLTWNVRRFDVFRMDDTSTHPHGVLGELGLSVRSRKVITQNTDRAEVELRLGDGQTAEDLQGVAKRLGSHAGTLRSGVTVVPGKTEGHVTVSLEYRDVLEETIPWAGPTHPGGSIADGLSPGLYCNGQPVWWYPAGNYAKNISPGHLAIGGMSGSGKGGFARVTILDLVTRRDVWLMGSDIRKGAQFTGPLAPALGWWADNPNSVKAQLKALQRAVDARNNALGHCDYESWTPKAFDDPRLRMPALVYWMEEAAAVMDDVNHMVVELGEASRSAGVILVFSAQRWSYDRVSPSLRFNLANVVCYGTSDDISPGFLLSDGTRAAAPEPSEWKTRFPGRALGEFNGVGEGLYPVPWKTAWAERAEAAAVVAEWAPRMAALDATTLAAFGETYTKRRDPTLTSLPAQTTDLAPDEEDEEDMPDDDSEYTIPKMDDPELDTIVEGMDLDDARAPLPPYEGPEVDMNPGPDGRPALSPELRRAEFAGMLEEFMDTGRFEFNTDELVEAWEVRIGPVQANQRPFLHDQLNDRIEHGQVERLGRGRYRLVALAEVGNSA